MFKLAKQRVSTISFSRASTESGWEVPAESSFTVRGLLIEAPAQSNADDEVSAKAVFFYKRAASNPMAGDILYGLQGSYRVEAVRDVRGVQADFDWRVEAVKEDS